MKPSTKPPALALWLMNQFHSDPSVVGDVLEEYGRGRSPIWFWKQTFSALATTPATGRLATVRWILALPIAMLAARTVFNVCFWPLFQISKAFSGAPMSGTPFGLPFQVAMGLTLFLTPASFVIALVWVVPSHKDAAARIALAVAVTGSALLMVIGAPPLSCISIMSGGTAAYLYSRSMRVPMRQSTS